MASAPVRRRGACRASALDRRTTVPIQHLGHVVLKVRNLARAERFYHDVLGLPIATRSSALGMIFFTLGDHHDFAIMQIGDDAPPADPAATGLFHVAFNIGKTI